MLRGQLGVGTLDTGEPLTPEQVRSLACDAHIIPAVLGGDGQVLDLGMSRRLFTGPVRRALVLRDGGCGFPGCDRPARWTEAHHMTRWAAGGPTNVDNGVLLCGAHHRLIHHSDWEVRLGTDRRPEFIPPAYIDPQRRPRRNILAEDTDASAAVQPIQVNAVGCRCSALDAQGAVVAAGLCVVGTA